MNGSSKRRLLTLVAVVALAASAGVWRFLQNDQRELAAGSTPGKWTVGETAAFADYPVFWLGEKFEGLALDEVVRNVVDDNPDSPVPTERDGFIFFYGTCTIRLGNDSCAVPLSVEVTPRCYVPPELFPACLKESPLRVGSGGYEVQVVAGATYVWAGDVVVRIGGGGASHERAVEALQAINSAVVGSEAAKLSSPNKSVCTHIQGRDREKVLSLSGDPAPTPTSEPAAPEGGGSYTILVDATRDGAVGAVQTAATFPTGAPHTIEVEALAVPSGLGGYSVVLSWDPAKLSVTAANIVDKTGFTQVVKSVNAAAGTLTVGYYNGADITCTNPAAGGAAEGASSAVLFEVTFTGVAAGLTSLSFNPALTEMAVCDGAGGVSAPTVLQSAGLTVSP